MIAHPATQTARFAWLRSPAFERGLVIVLAAYIALLGTPVSIHLHGVGLDASWILGLNMAHGLAHSQGLAAGRDFVFTYGPLGYLFYPETSSGTPLLALIFRLGLWIFFAAGLFRLAWILPSKTAAFWTIAIIGLAAALDALPAEDQLVLVIEMAALTVLADRSEWRYLQLAILAFLSGLGLVAKLDQGMEGAALFVTVAVTASLQDRSLSRRARHVAAAAVCALPLSAVAFFLAATGSISALIPYIRNGWQIVSGYSEAMGLPGPFWQAALAVALITASFLAITLVSDVGSLWPGMLPAVLIAYFAFKHAMVRQDAGHAATFQMRFAVALLFPLVCAKATRDRRLIVIWQLFSVVLAGAVLLEAYPGFSYIVKSRLDLHETSRSLADFRHWRTAWDKIGAGEQRERESLRLPERFHQIIGNGSVDAVPWDVDVVKANGWKWQPRPVFQSYSAYTPALDALNAAHIGSRRAADFTILNFSAIDGRHPFLETPLSWRALLDRYDLALACSNWLVLQRRCKPRFGPLKPFRTSTAHWDQDVLLPPSDGLLVMAPRIRASLLGKIETLLFRPTPVSMEATFRSGKRMRWRCVERNLAGGVLIRPFPQDLRDLRGTFQPAEIPADQDRVISIRFETAWPAEFAGEIPIVWSVLPVNPAESQAEARSARRYPLPQSTLLALLWRAGDPLPLVHAWFEKADRIEAFFGKQIDGRGVHAIAPVNGQWLDVYLNMSQNEFWEEEHGTTLRFDPVSSFGPGTGARIAVLWGSAEAAAPVLPDVQFYPAPVP